MSNLTAHRGACLAPFLDLSTFQSTNGFIAGRFCAPADQILPGTVCCLPCPSAEWLYPDSFSTWSLVAESINAVSIAACLFLLVSFLCLPVEKTRRHYLSVGLVIGTFLMALGFVVPLAVKPEQCYDEITPNDMYSSLTCAWSGAFITSGGLTVAMWIFIRALSMHLQICWDVLPGKRFFYAAQGLGWGVVAILFTCTITFTGVSFRFGDACHVNSAHSLADFWGPLLGIAGISAIIQLATFVYCIHVYLKNMWSDEKTETNSSAGLPSYTSSVRMQSARAVYRRVRKVLWLQWRGILIVVFILIDVIFFSIVFVYLDAMENASHDDIKSLTPWILCLVSNPENKEKCFQYAEKALVNKETIIAILIMLSLAGIQAFFLLVRGSMFTGWVQLIGEKFAHKSEFVSLDARRFSADARTFELLNQKPRSSILKSPTSTVTSPTETYNSPIGRSTPDYFQKEITREYRSPTLSFSSPRAPQASPNAVDWDPRSTHARGGLGFHPVMEDDTVMENKI
ncbi:hypothetical protein M501DRAFT_940269 [Patellaria atrata CBS 101060]|uniref:G-protein coupled receptors family 2 profile 2 domain-containing protein n=1 Tax=Patellaria atrata CBS 101060 TaxID=1346257 RepID=A0A9P4S6Y4_9PEZI|nr:hypothetical protein M501DRAFT_940269 [Patellaria atrata CBS 101060]